MEMWDLVDQLMTICQKEEHLDYNVVYENWGGSGEKLPIARVEIDHENKQIILS